MSASNEAALEARTFRFPHRDDDGAFSKLVHKDNANGALDLMEKAWRKECDSLIVEVKKLRRYGDKLRTGSITGEFEMDDLEKWDEVRGA